MTRKGGNRPVRPPERGGLTPQDAELWSRTAQSLDPLRRAKPRVTADKAEPSPASHDQPAAPQRTPVLRSKVPPEAPARASRPTNAPPPLADFDQRKLRKIASGRAEIEARIDLHGLRQSEAHHRLRSFVLDAYARGLRSVLVITGKGGGGTSANEMLDGRHSERGVIRRNVPVWLEEPELRAVVVSFARAHVRHGGDGALYVHLRRRRKQV
jgi:DNA-nicking Smr family endonuclease